MSNRWHLVIGLLALTGNATLSRAQVIVPGADGSDGPFNPTSSVQVRLDLAPTGTWDGPNPDPGQGRGVYDPEKWAVVFRYSSVNIPSGVTVSFFNHPSNPPVVWLVDGPVTINGTLSLNAANPPDPTGFDIGGPGGFRGAGNQPGVGGLGPGGGAVQQGGNYAYGNSRVMPLIGGSGSGRNQSYGYAGHGGGGAILLAASGPTTLNGQIRANGAFVGGGIGGAGGGIRLVCDQLEGSGTIQALGGTNGGGPGRIRIEANEISFASTGNPTASFGLPGETAEIWPDDAVAPGVKVVSFGPAPVPTDPNASFEFPYADVNLTSGVAQLLVIECRNIPTGSDPPGTPAWNVKARVVPRGGGAPFTVNATYNSGDYVSSIWHATITLPDGFSAVQVRASMP